MRSQGLVAEVPDPGGSDHLCWVYDDDASLDAAVGQFLSGGLARGERLLCVGDGVVDRMRSDDPPLPDAAALLESGALEMLTVAEAYDASGEFSVERQFEYYGAATRRALADGYTGLRVVAELSTLAADAGHRRELMRWEHAADEFMASGSGMTAMCAYRAELGPRTLADVTSAHPLVRATDGGPPFRVFVDDGRIALAGSVDTFCADRLATLLASSPAQRDGAVVDLALVEFVDVAATRVLARWARGLQERSLDVELRGTSPLFRRMWRVLGLDELVPGALAESA